MTGTRPGTDGIVTAHAVITQTKDDNHILDGRATVKDQNGKEVMHFTSLFKIDHKQEEEK